MFGFYTVNEAYKSQTFPFKRENMSISSPKHDMHVEQQYVSETANVRFETANVRFETARRKLEHKSQYLLFAIQIYCFVFHKGIYHQVQSVTANPVMR